MEISREIVTKSLEESGGFYFEEKPIFVLKSVNVLIVNTVTCEWRDFLNFHRLACFSVTTKSLRKGIQIQF